MVVFHCPVTLIEELILCKSFRFSLLQYTNISKPERAANAASICYRICCETFSFFCKAYLHRSLSIDPVDLCKWRVENNWWQQQWFNLKLSIAQWSSSKRAERLWWISIPSHYNVQHPKQLLGGAKKIYYPARLKMQRFHKLFVASMPVNTS